MSTRQRKSSLDQISVRQVCFLGLFFLAIAIILKKQVLPYAQNGAPGPAAVGEREAHDDYVIHTPWGDHDIVIHTYPEWKNMKIFKHLDTLENLRDPKDMPEKFVQHFPIHEDRMPREPLALKTYPSIFEKFEGSKLTRITEFSFISIPNSFIGDGAVFDMQNFYSFGYHWLGDQNLYKEIDRIEEAHICLSVNAWGGEAFNHFQPQALPKFSILMPWLDKYPEIQIVSHNENPLHKWWWKKLGYTDRIVTKPINAASKWAVHCSMSFFFHTESPESYGCFPRDSLYFVQKKIGVMAPLVEKPYILYFKRGGSRRAVSNTKEMERRVAEYWNQFGVELRVFQPKGGMFADGGREQDLQTIRHAKVIMGPHGGMWANLVFARPRIHVIEFNCFYNKTKEPKPRDMYWGMAQAAGVYYWHLEAEEWNGHEKQMKINIDELLEIMKRIKQDEFKPVSVGS